MSFGCCPKGRCEAGSRQGECLTPRSCPPEAMQNCLGKEGERSFGGFHCHAWEKDPVAAKGPDPKGMGTHRRSSSGLYGSWVKLEDRQGKMAHWPLHSPSYAGAGAGHIGLHLGQMNDPKQANGVQPHLSQAICKWVGLTLTLTMSFKAEQSLTDHEVEVKGGAWASGPLLMSWQLRESPAPSSFGTWKWLRAAV